MAAVSVRNLTYTYPNSSEPNLRDVSLEVESGEFLLVCGPTGGGKSTLCRCILGLIPHFYGGEMLGEVRVLGMDTRETPPSKLTPRVGMIFQNPEDQLVAMSIEEEVAFGPENLGLPRDEIKRRVDEALRLVGIENLRGRSPYELSSGQQQRVAIASILSMRPEILILDEPTSQIDPKSAIDIISLVHRLNKESGMTVVMTEHRLENAAQYADRIVVIGGGRVTHNGRPREVLQLESLTGHGVPVPKIIQLSNRLMGTGVRFDNLPLTVEEAAATLGRMLK
jgi:energy-coupling factor transporter ATP-binding protein EcfA2